MISSVIIPSLKKILVNISMKERPSPLLFLSLFWLPSKWWMPWMPSPRTAPSWLFLLIVICTWLQLSSLLCLLTLPFSTSLLLQQFSPSLLSDGMSGSWCCGSLSPLLLSMRSWNSSDGILWRLMKSVVQKWRLSLSSAFTKSIQIFIVCWTSCIQAGVSTGGSESMEFQNS